MFYSVANGRSVGVFTSWSLCNEAVGDYPGAVFRKWETLKEAVQHLNRHGIQNDAINVRTDEELVPLLGYCGQLAIPVPAGVPYAHQKLFKLGGGTFVGIGRTDDVIHMDLHHRDYITGLPKGNVLTLGWDQWIVLLSLQQILEDSFARLKIGEPIHVSECLGNGAYVSIDTPYPIFNIRHWYTHNGLSKPTRRGITLHQNQWSNLININHLLELSYEAMLKEIPVDSD